MDILLHYSPDISYHTTHLPFLFVSPFLPAFGSSADYHISAQSLLANAVIGKLPEIQPNPSSSGNGITGNSPYGQPSSGSGARTSSRQGHGLPSSQRYSSPPGTAIQ